MKLFTFHEFFAKVEDTMLGKKFSDVAFVAVNPNGSIATAGMMSSDCDHCDGAVEIIALLLVGVEATAKKLKTPQQRSNLVKAIAEMSSSIAREGA